MVFWKESHVVLGGLVGKDIVGYLQVIRTEQANAHSMDEISVLLLRPEGFMGVL